MGPDPLLFPGGPGMPFTSEFCLNKFWQQLILGPLSKSLNGKNMAELWQYYL